MIEALVSLPTHLRKRLASALESGLLTPPYSTMSLQSVLGSREGDQDLLGALRELEQMGISGLAAAAWMRTVEEVTSRTPQPDLVWSGPEVPGLHARDTRRVYEELLSSAERSVWASTFAFWDGPKAFKVLAKRMDVIGRRLSQRAGHDHTGPVHAEMEARVVVPPTKTASLSRRGARSGARDRTIGRVKALGRRRWKKASGYHQQARVENAFFRYTSIVGDCLRARSSSGQRREAVLACNVLNRMTELGRPVSYRIGR